MKGRHSASTISAPAADRSGPAVLLQRPGFHLLLLGVAVVLTYGHTLNYPFIFDDASSIRENASIYDLGDLASIWKFATLRFVGYLSFALNYHFHQYAVTGYHLVNILIHFLAGVAAYALLYGLLRTPVMRGRLEPGQEIMLALAGALLFLVHPLQTQAVTYIVQRLASLGAMFYLAALAAYVRARTGAGLRRGSMAAAAVFALLAFFTKQHTATLPLAILLIEWVFFPGRIRRMLLPAAVAGALFWLAYGLLVALLDYHPFSLRAMDAITRETDAISRSAYLATQMRVLWLYIRLFFLPYGQHLDYDLAVSAGFADPAVLLAMAGHLLVIVFAVRQRAERPLLTFAVLFYYLAHLVESSAIPIRDVVFEHRAYLPNFGLCSAAAYGLLQLGKDRKARWAAAVVLLPVVVLGVLTVARNTVWRDSITLWEDNVRQTPAKARPHNNLGLAYARAGRLAEAVAHFSRAIELQPAFADAHNNLGLAYAQQGKAEEAMVSYQAAIRANPAKAGPYNNIGLLYYQVGSLDQAAAYFRQALELEPENAGVHLNLGAVLFLREDLAGAERQYLEALRQDPANAGARHNLGQISAVRGDYGQAIVWYREAIANRPDQPAVYKDLALALNNLGKRDEALVQLAKALEISPDYAEALYHYRLISGGAADAADPRQHPPESPSR